MSTSSIVRACLAIGAVSLALAPAKPACAQQLGRASSAVRGDASGGGASSGGGRLDGAGVVVRGSSGGSSSGSSRGSSGGSWGGSSGSVASHPSSPDPEPSRPVQPSRPVRSGPPARVVPQEESHSTFVVVPPSSVVVQPAPASVAVDAQPAPSLEEAEPQRDHWYGGSLGVRLVGPIVPPPRAVADEPDMLRGAAGSPTSSLEPPADLEIVEPAHHVIGIASAEGGYVLDGIGRGTVAGRVQLPASVDVFASYTGYFEPRPEGFDALVLGRVGVGLRAIDEQEAQLRIGVAMRHFHDWLGSVFGIDGVLGLDVMIEAPVVLSAEASIGTAGAAMVAQLRGTLGLRFGQVDVYAGYEHVTLQPFDSDLGGVDLGGPIAGVSVVVD